MDFSAVLYSYLLIIVLEKLSIWKSDTAWIKDSGTVFLKGMVTSKLHLSRKSGEANKTWLGTFFNISALRGASACHSNGFLWHRLDLPVCECCAKSSSSAKQSWGPGCWASIPTGGKLPSPTELLLQFTITRASIHYVLHEERKSGRRRGSCQIFQGPSNLSEELLESYCSTMS